MIVYSPTSIINGVLIYYRYPTITSVNDTPTSQALYVNLNNTIVQVQSSGLAFGFLQSSANLTTPDPTLSWPRFQYGFILPSDYLRKEEVVDDNDYKIVGRVIYTNKSSVKLIYYRLDLTYNYPTHFYEYLVAFMANKYCLSLTQSKIILESVQSAFNKTLADAQTAELQSMSVFENSYIPQRILSGGG